MEVWSGAIGSETRSPLQGVGLIDTFSSGHCNLSKGAKLSISSLVNPNLIPLYAKIGPSLEVHIADIDTSEWVKTRLLGGMLLEDDEYYEDTGIQGATQCPNGLLVEVANSKRDKKTACNITDFLIYGILSPSTTTASRPRTPPPPSSSNDGLETESDDDISEQELKIYAAPLNSKLIEKVQALPSPPTSPPSESAVLKDDEEEYAEFLPDLRSPSPRRKRVATLFELATQNHRNVRRKGGEAVSQLMAAGNARPQTSQLKDIKKERACFSSYNEDDDGSDLDPPLPELPRRARSLSIAKKNQTRPSTSPDLELKANDKTSRHKRGPSLITHGRKPSGGSAFLDSLTIRTSPKSKRPTTPLAPPNEPPEKTISENKALLTRTILTSMRLYGYHRNKQPQPQLQQASSSSAADHAVSQPPEAGADDDEFKSMYHATYRASTFALRGYLNPPSSPVQMPVLNKERAMGMVDEFLRLFCEGNL